jgi:hypothetical protein
VDNARLMPLGELENQSGQAMPVSPEQGWKEQPLEETPALVTRPWADAFLKILNGNALSTEFIGERPLSLRISLSHPLARDDGDREIFRPRQPLHRHNDL